MSDTQATARPPEYPPPAAAPPGAGAAIARRKRQQAQANGIKETIESILIAFILAFIFRAFVVEAFVIPTGSMAPTLLGAHIRYRCPDCGYTFDVNREPDRPEDASDTMEFPAMSYAPDEVYCPNCGYRVAAGPIRNPNGLLRRQEVLDSNGHPIRDSQGAYLTGPAYPTGTPQEQVRFGDRILVLKYAYLFQEPKRWDVVVFKAPDNPQKDHYTLNFIKRLVAKPGENLMVLDGDVYLQAQGGNWQVQTKPDAVQQSLWRIIYDNDFHPQGLPRPDRSQPWREPWKTEAASGWDIGTSGASTRVFKFNGKGPGQLTFDPAADPATQTTNDYLVYDIPGNQRRIGQANLPDGDNSRSIVSDLRLSLWYQRTSGAGPLSLTLSKRDDTFTARIDRDFATLTRTTGDGQTITLQGPVPLAVNAAVPVEFTNVDYQVTLKVGGKVVLQSTPAQYAPNIPQLLDEYMSNSYSQAAHKPPTIAISAQDQTCELAHVSLSRDVYYTNKSDQLMWGTPKNPVHLHRRGDKREDGTICDDDEYFVMGDNSLMSLDARYWREPIDLPDEGLRMEAGRVPGRFLLGRAFFVYWPAGFKPADALPPIIPNFGDMRFIH